jgi:RNA polymerase sigma-70 factor (ECF subfamily)
VISDVELLEAWRAGDKTAGNRLVRRYFARVHHFFKSKVKSGAEDLTQQTFLACVEARDRVDAKRGFRPYLFGIARGKLLHHYRRIRRHDARLNPLETSVAALDGNVSGLVASRQEQRLLLLALRKLPLDYQIALEMYYWEDMKVTEVAAVLGAPEGTVKARLARARDQLREQIAELATDPNVRDTTVKHLEDWARSLRADDEDSGSDP